MAKQKQKPEWKEIELGQYDRIYWCKGCGCIKIDKLGRKIRYETPRRERQRRIDKKLKDKTKAETEYERSLRLPPEGRREFGGRS